MALDMCPLFIKRQLRLVTISVSIKYKRLVTGHRIRSSPAEKQHIFGGPGFAVYRKCFD